MEGRNNRDINILLAEVDDAKRENDCVRKDWQEMQAISQQASKVEGVTNVEFSCVA